MLGAIAQHYVESGGATPSWTDAMTALAPYAWYKMDEASGTTLIDSGSGALNGVTASSNITHNQASIIPGNTSGKSKITASGGQIDTGSFVTSRAVSGWTIVWTYKGTSANIAGTGRIFNGGSVQINAGASDIELRQFGSDTTTRSLGSRAAMLAGSAVMVTMVCAVGDQRLYINDTLNGSQTVDPGVDPAGTSVFRFARGGGSDYLSGQYDDICFIAGALSGAQVSSLYASWLAPAA